MFPITFTRVCLSSIYLAFQRKSEKKGTKKPTKGTKKPTTTNKKPTTTNKKPNGVLRERETRTT